MRIVYGRAHSGLSATTLVESAVPALAKERAPADIAEELISPAKADNRKAKGWPVCLSQRPN